MDWNVLPDNVGSEHLPILMTIHLHNVANNQQKTKIQYTKLKTILPTINFNDTKDLEFEEKLENLIKQYIKVQLNAKHTDKPWWTEKLKRLWDIKKGKLKLYNK